MASNPTREKFLQAIVELTESGGNADDALHEALFALVGLFASVRDQKGWSERDRIFIDALTERLCLMMKGVDHWRKAKRAGLN